MEQQKNEFNGEVSERTEYKEIYEISTTYNRGVEKISNLMNRVKEEEEQKHLNEIRFLQAQINPHFLSNTLLNIRCLVEMHQQNKVLNMLNAFSAILRYSIPDSNVFIGIKEELNYLEQYVRLMAIRYSDHTINFETNISEEASMAVLPRMLLQPIVENAIVHGLQGNENGIDIYLYAEIADKGETLKIRILDNGIGMTEDVLKNIHKPKEDNKIHNHIGLSNIEERIRLIYGNSDRFGVCVLSEEGIGTEVIVEIENRRLEHP